VRLRATTDDDLPALYTLFLASIADVYRPHGFPPPAPGFDVFAAQQRHILRQDPTLCRVAEEAGEPVGFASAWVRDGDWFLASLFVASAAQARGSGAALLAAVWGDGLERRRTITDAIQPISNGLYARRGLIPVTPILAFSGTPSADAELEQAVPDAAELARIDGVAYGFDRRVDHVYWASIARRTGWKRAGEIVAYSYVFPGGAIGPVAGVDSEAASGALAGELAAATGSVVVRIPGAARGLVGTALSAGLRLGPTPGLLLLSAAAEPAPAVLAISSYTLF